MAAEAAMKAAAAIVLLAAAALPATASATYPGRNGTIAALATFSSRSGPAHQLHLKTPAGRRKGVTSCLVEEEEEDPDATPGVCAQGPAWSPDGRRLAFAASGDLAVARPDGKGRQLLRLPEGLEAQYPAWSPDGRQLLFAGTRDGATDLYVVPAGGGAPIQRTTDGCDRPAWSAKGSIACVRGGRILIMASGSDEPIPLARGFRPDWSPSGRFLVYHRGRRIFRIRATRGAKPKLITRGTSPAYSPDGRRLLFVRHRSSRRGAFSHLMVARTSGRGAKVLFRGHDDGGSAEDFFLDWSDPAWQPRPRG